MAVEYVELDQSNVNDWKNQLYTFAATLDIDLRCNSAAVQKQRLTLTYPSMNAIGEFVDRGDLVVVAHDAGNIVGYMICVDDTNGKYGGCQCRWIGVNGIPPGQRHVVFAAMGDVAVARYGWLWGRVTNIDIKNLLVGNIVDAESEALGPDIVTYKRPEA